MNSQNYSPSSVNKLDIPRQQKIKNSAKNSYKRFNILFLSFIFISLTLFGGFNFLIDPYGIYDSPKVASINKYKSEQMAYDRIFQAIEIIKRKPNVLFLGSSTVQFGLDTRYFPNNESYEVYNLGLQNANIREINQYFKHALVNNPDIKTVVMGVDLFIFEKDKEDNPNYDQNRLEKKIINFKDIANTLFSFSAFDASVKTIKNNLNGTASHLEYINGMLYYDPGKPVPGSLDRFVFFLKGVFRKKPEQNRFSQERLDYFREIVQICQEKNIDLMVFISPSHATQWTGTEAAGNWYWEEWENWKKELVKITPIWDFSGYSSVTTEPVSDDMKNYYDSSHYRPVVSQLILAKMLNNNPQVPDDFGVLLTPENLEQNLQRIREEKELRKQTHPEETEIINNLRK